MFRGKDKEEELKRLQEQLLEEEDVAEDETPAQEDYLDEELLDSLLEDSSKAGSAGVYQNYSNGYGKNLRNYASGYKAYNSDTTDTDLERFSEEVREPKKGSGLLTFLLVLMILLCIAAAVLLWRYLRIGGIL